MRSHLAFAGCASVFLVARCSSTPPPGGPCSTHADCSQSSAGPLCDAKTRACVACLSSGDCFSPKLCDPTRGVCVGCTRSTDCAAGQVCADAACKPGCSADKPCPPGAVCDLGFGACVACLSDGDCPAAQVCRQKACVAGCSANQPCATGRVCDLTTLSCVECVTDAQCGGATARCSVAQNRCVQCLPGADDCPLGDYCDSASLICRVGCRRDEDCTAGSPSPASQGMARCLIASHACVACLSSADCAPGNVCGNDNKCAAGCVRDADCAGGQVCCGGACASLGTHANCNACGDACGAGQGCCARNCVSLSTVANCSACGAACGPGKDCCGGSCVAINTTIDCGACGIACSTGNGCCGGICLPLTTPVNCASCGRFCGTGEGCCGGACTSLSTETNCGSCGRLCATGEGCCGGACIPLSTATNCGACGNACGPGKDCCNRTCASLTTVQNCGACGTPCGVGELCTAGACRPPASCAAFLQSNPAAVDGAYDIDPDGPAGNPAFRVYCDMTTDGGGWTLVMNVAPADGNSVGYNNQQFWTADAEYGIFANRSSNDYKSPAAYRLVGTQLLIQSTTPGTGGTIIGWRRWPLQNPRTFDSFFSTGIVAVHGTDTCETGNPEASNVVAVSPWDDVMRQGNCLYADVNPSGSGEADLIRLTTIPGNNTDNNMSGFASCIDCGTPWQGAQPYQGLDRAPCNTGLCAYNQICRMPSADCLGNYCAATYSTTSCGAVWNNRIFIR